MLYAKLIRLPVPFCSAGTAGNRISTILREEDGRRKVNWNYYRVLEGQGEVIAALREDFRIFLEDMFERGDVQSFRFGSRAMPSSSTSLGAARPAGVRRGA